MSAVGAEILAEVERRGRAVRNGRHKRTIRNLERAGLVAVDWGEDLSPLPMVIVVYRDAAVLAEARRRESERRAKRLRTVTEETEP